LPSNGSQQCPQLPCSTAPVFASWRLSLTSPTLPVVISQLVTDSLSWERVSNSRRNRGGNKERKKEAKENYERRERKNIKAKKRKREKLRKEMKKRRGRLEGR
jgi:hypothetical protein